MAQPNQDTFWQETERLNYVVVYLLFFDIEERLGEWIVLNLQLCNLQRKQFETYNIG